MARFLDPKIIENRIAVYKKETAPVKAYYENQNKPALDFVIAECNETLLDDNCKNIYFNE